MENIVHYLKIWLRLSLSSFQVALVSRFGAVLFTLAKLMRFGFFLSIVYLVVNKTNTLVGYTLTQSIVIFLTYNVIDTATQLFFRDVYRFRQKIVSGDFDLILIKPINPLFRVLLGGADPMDLLVLVPYGGLLIFFMVQTKFTFGLFVSFMILILNAFMISAAFHIVVLALGILTTEIDHMIMMYRDITSMARFPVDIYEEPLRGFITFVIPVGIMMTFPARALFGLLSLPLILISLGIGIGIFAVSLKLWKMALTKYTSASS